MLSIGKLGRGQERYYLGKVAEGAEDYYSGEGEAAGYWLGDVAEDLGLQGKVDPGQLVGMLTGQNPATGEPLGLQHVSGSGPVPGFDLTFSAPKSASILWALGGHPVAAEVKGAHASSVEAAVGYLQREACWTRRGKGGREFVQGSGFLGAGYVHRSSRAGDMQIHTHLLIANATQGPDGRWTRLYHPAIYEHAKAAGFIYEAHFRDELTQRLGVGWQKVENGIAEIEGFSAEQLRHFSTRREEILEAAGEGASARSLQVATLVTREAKDRDLTTESLREIWREKGEEVGLTRESVRAVCGREVEAFDGRLQVAEVEAALVAQRSHFGRRDVIQAVGNCLRSGAPGAEVEELADGFLSAGEVIRIAASPRGDRYTTREIWELERKALATVEEMGVRRDRAVVSEIVVARVLAERPKLKPDQEAMVGRLLSGGEGVAVVVGEAGSGKTYALTAAAHGWAHDRTELRVAAPTWRAANVLRSEGLSATSVARLLAELDRGTAAGQQALARGSVLVVDEAGMVDSRAMARLVQHAHEADAKLVLIGDPAQLGEIEAGGLFASVAARTDPIVLDEVVRHRHDLDRESAKSIREGEGREALGAYFQEGRVFVSADAAERREAMVRDWWESFQADEDSLMIAKTNREVAALNAAARERMRAAERLGTEEIEVGEARFAAGDQVITRINDQRQNIYNRERWTVAEVDRESGTVELVGIDTRGRVCVDSDYLGRLRERDGGPALEHGYAATTYQAQGATVDRAYVAVDPSMDRQEFYVAASRSREETFLYATPEVRIEREEFAPRDPYLRHGLDHIAEAAERNGAQASAHDEALRSQFAELSTADLAAQVRELRSEAGAERHNEARHQRAESDLQRYGEQLEHYRNASHTVHPSNEERALEQIAAVQAERDQLAEVSHEARAKAAVAEHVLSERARLAATAARVSPPDYITNELGERPTDPKKAGAWDRGVSQIESYRTENGVVDRDNALGPTPHERHAEQQQRQARQALERTQRQLQLQRQRQRATERSVDLGMGR
jgi:conjugative relaxase-like TrwC/TraI family protein